MDGSLMSDGVKAWAGAIVAAFGVVAAFWYGLLSLMCAIVYEPLGVAPREVGLGPGAVLAQAGVGFAAVLVGTAAYVLAVEVVPSALFHRPRDVKWLAWFGIFALVGVLGLTFIHALRGRHALAEGRKPPSLYFFLPVPWRAVVVEPQWATAMPKGVALPSCALYLGQDAGTVVLHHADTDADGPDVDNTLRLAARAVVLRLKPAERSCRP